MKKCISVLLLFCMLFGMVGDAAALSLHNAGEITEEIAVPESVQAQEPEEQASAQEDSGEESAPEETQEQSAQEADDEAGDASEDASAEVSEESSEEAEAGSSEEEPAGETGDEAPSEDSPAESEPVEEQVPDSAPLSFAAAPVMAGATGYVIDGLETIVIGEFGAVYKNELNGEALEKQDLQDMGLSYDEFKDAWIMDGFSFTTGADCAIKIEAESATIILSAGNSITCLKDTGVPIKAAMLTICGDGSLTVSSSHYGIDCSGQLVVSGTPTITVSSSWMGIHANIFSMTGGKLTVTAGGTGIALSVSGLTLGEVVAEVSATADGKNTTRCTTVDELSGKLYFHVEPAVARIGSTMYKSVQEGVDAAGDGDTVVMLASSAENIQVASGKNLSLDLKGRTLRSSAAGSTITNAGTLTIIDSSSAGSGTVTLGTGLNGDVITNSKKLTINAGTFTSCSGADGSVITNSSILIINAGTFTIVSGANGTVVTNSGIMDMNGGTITGGTGIVYNNYLCGGGIFNTGSLKIGGSALIYGNSAVNGAGIYSCDKSAELTIGGSAVIRNNTATRYGGGIFSSNEAIAKICESAVICSNTAGNYGGGIYNNWYSTLIITGGTIGGASASDGNTAKSGGGVYTTTDGANEISGCTISHNTATASGGGIYNADTLSIYGSTVISYNTAGQDGGGVGGETITIGGNVQIIYNEAGQYGGGVCGGTSLTVSGNVKISNNTAVCGGGVYSIKTFNFNGGTVSDNNATQYGGGIHVRNTLNMTSGTVSGNSAPSGGGISYGGYYIDNDTYSYQNTTMTISGGSITGNTATTGVGGGIALKMGITVITGGSITGNSAATQGGGIGYFSDADGYPSRCPLEVGGTANITGNTVGGADNNLHLPQVSGKTYCQTVTVRTDKPLTGSALIGVTTGITPSVGSPVSVTGVNSADYSTYFVADKGSPYAAINEDDTVKLGVAVCRIDNHYYTSVQSAVDAAGTSATIVMIIDSQENVTVPSGKDITLDLNGRSLVGAGSGSVITNNGTLSIIDSDSTRTHYFRVGSNGLWMLSASNSTAIPYASLSARPASNETITVGGGCIVGGSAESGGAICSNGALTISAGNIIGNKASASGGAIAICSGSLIISGGIIAGNTAANGGALYVDSSAYAVISGSAKLGYNKATAAGGAVSLNGILTMSGGTVNGNLSDGSDSAITASSGASCTISGGSITGNTAASGGAVSGPGAITLSGSANITGNKSGTTGCNIYLPKDTYLTVGYDFNGKAGLTLETVTGRATNIGSGDYAKYFVSDNTDYVAVKKSGNYVEIVSIDETVAVNTDTGTYYYALDTAVKDAGSGHTIQLLADCAENISVSGGKNLTIDLNGKKLTGSGNEATIYNGGTLTITDSSSGGTVTRTGSVSYSVIINKGTLTVSGGTITGGSAANGAGIYNDGTLTVSGGTIAGNTAQDYGGGIYNCKTLTVSGGIIAGNSASKGGGIYNKHVSADCSFALSGGTISNNTATYGGGVYAENTGVEVTGGTVTGNTAASSGGGMELRSCTSSIADASVTGNTARAAYPAGGVYVYKGSITLSGNVIIIGNSTVSGGNTISANLCLDGNINGKPLITGTMSNTTPVGVTYMVNASVTSGAFSKNADEGGRNASVSDFAYFMSDNSSYKLSVSGNSLALVEPVCFTDANGNGQYDAGSDLYYKSVTDAVAQAGTDEFKIVMCADTKENVYIASGKNISLNLNGCTLEASTGYPPSAIINSGVLTLTDSSSAGTGTIKGTTASAIDNRGTITIYACTITGSEAENGGGIYNRSGATLTIMGGKITGNKVSENGGGIYNEGTLIIAAAIISSNTATKSGSGIYNTGTLTVSTASFEANSANADGGAIYNAGTLTVLNVGFERNSANNGGGIYNAGTLTVLSSSFTANTATANGGGIYCDGTVTVGGALGFASNTSSANGSDNLYLPTGKYLALATGTDALCSGASIPVRLQSGKGQFTSGGTAADAQFFSSDVSGYSVCYNPNGYLEILKPVCYIETGTDGVYTPGEDTAFESITAALAQAGTNAATIVLMADTKENVTVSSGQNITLDLKGYVLSGSGYEVIVNAGTLTVQDTSTGTSHKFSVGDDGLWTLDDVNGTQTVTGGVITGGTAGGIINGPDCTLNITGGNIAGNSGNGGGICNLGTMTMSGGSSCGNTDGGICNEGTLTMSGGSICGNTAFNSGGGIFSGENALITITGGTISNNSVTNNDCGGGIYIASKLSNTISGCTIKDNTAQYGGGVYNMGTVTILSSEITGNTAVTGGGVYNKGSLTLGGATKITGNTASKAGNNLYLRSEKYITLATGADTLSDGASIGIALEDVSGKFSSNGTAADSVYFTSDVSGYSACYNTKGYLELLIPVCYIENGTDGVYTPGVDSVFGNVSDAFNSAQKGVTTTVVLIADSSTRAVVGKEETVILDLNGYVLSANEGKNILAVAGGGTLTIRDSGTDKTHKFTVNDDGVWVLDEENGTKTVSGGVITGADIFEAYSNEGGCIDNAGTVNFESGTLVGNKAVSGGAVYIDHGTFNMTGGTITGNKGRYGGAVYVYGGTFNMTGGIVTENRSTQQGDGVFTAGNVTVGGTAKITGNYSNYSASNLFVSGVGSVGISADVPLAEGAQIGVTLISRSGKITYNGAPSDIPYFTSDNSIYIVVINPNNGKTPYLELIETPVCYIETGTDGVYTPGEDTYYRTVLEATYTLKNYTTTTIVLCADISDYISIPQGKYVIFDLHGHTLTGSYYGHNALANFGRLTLCDTVGGGKIIGSNCYVVENRNELTITGGIITGGSSENGGGVYNMSGAYLTISGGTITGNTATKNGGGIYSEGLVTVLGGTITGNTAGEKGGGIYSGGRLVIGGKASVTGNTVASEANNLYLPTGKTIIPGSGANAFVSGASVGVTAEDTAYPVKLSENYGDTEDYTSCFTSDESGKFIINIAAGTGSQYLALTTQHTVSFELNGHGDAIENQTVYNGEKAAKPADPSANGYVFDGWYGEATFENAWDFDTAITADTTIYAKWLTVPTAADFSFVSPDNTVYDGNAKEAQVTSSKSGMGEITVNYYDSEGALLSSAPVDAGTYTVKIDVAAGTDYTAITGLTDESWTFTVTGKDLSTCTAEGFSLAYIENGKSIEPKPVVKDGDKVLSEGKDYVLSYSGNTESGTATVTVSGTGNYTGSVPVTFTITKPGITKISNYKEGKAPADAVVTIGEGTVLTANDFKAVYVDGTELASENYTVEDGCIKLTLIKSYLNTLKVGKHTLTVELGGEYDGIKCETTFTVKSASSSPATGDNSMLGLWLALESFSLLSIGAVLSRKRKKAK